MAFLTVGKENSADIQLYYEDRGSGPPVVLIHGWPLSGRSWEPQVLPLVEAGHRVITYDRRGFGASSQPWEGYDYDTLAADLKALLEHLDLTDVTLVGFSMGGGEVSRYIGAHGTKRIARAVLAAAVPPFLYVTDDNPDGGLDDGAIAGFEEGITGDRLAFLEQFVQDFFNTEARQDLVSEPMRHHMWNVASVASPKATLDCVAAFGKTDFRKDLEAFDVPTLVIHGDSDVTVPFEVNGKRSHAAIEGAELALIMGAPHGCNVTHAKEFNAALLGFLGS